MLTLPHADLGLLSFCWQDVPGLELYAPELAGQRWLPTSARGEHPSTLSSACLPCTQHYQSSQETPVNRPAF